MFREASTPQEWQALSAAWLADDRLNHHAAVSAERRSHGGDGRQAGPAGDGAGLVSLKTSGRETEIHLPTDHESLILNRVKRLRKNVWAAGKLISQSAGKHLRCWFVTLTYRGVDDWQPRHLSDAFKAFRRWCAKRSIRPRYVWVAELQQRGALHYHIALWLPVGVSCPMWDKGGRNYLPFWPHGMTNRTLAKNAVGYLMKYMSKVGKYHEFPKGARIYGAGGLEPEQRQFKSWLNYPQWLKQVCAVGESVIRAGRRVFRETGEVLRSPYEIVHRYGSMYLRTVRPVPDAWVSGAWSRLNTAGPALPVSMPVGAA